MNPRPLATSRIPFGMQRVQYKQIKWAHTQGSVQSIPRVCAFRWCAAGCANKSGLQPI